MPLAVLFMGNLIRAITENVALRGRILLANREGGGLSVTLDLPLAPR